MFDPSGAIQCIADELPLNEVRGLYDTGVALGLLGRSGEAEDCFTRVSLYYHQHDREWTRELGRRAAELSALLGEPPTFTKAIEAIIRRCRQRLKLDPDSFAGF